MELLDGVSTQKERTRLVLNNILFATDFSPSSEMALKYALTLARHYHAKIHIIQAVALDSVEAIASDARQRALDEERSFAVWCAKKLRLSGKLDGVRHQVLVGEEGESVLPTLLHNQDFDLFVNGVGNREGHTLLLEPRRRGSHSQGAVPAAQRWVVLSYLVRRRTEEHCLCYRFFV